MGWPDFGLLSIPMHWYASGSNPKGPLLGAMTKAWAVYSESTSSSLESNEFEFGEQPFDAKSQILGLYPIDSSQHRRNCRTRIGWWSFNDMLLGDVSQTFVFITSNFLWIHYCVLSACHGCVSELWSGGTRDRVCPHVVSVCLWANFRSAWGPWARKSCRTQPLHMQNSVRLSPSPVHHSLFEVSGITVYIFFQNSVVRELIKWLGFLIELIFMW